MAVIRTMRNSIITLLIIFTQCNSNDKKFILIDSELIESRIDYENENIQTLDRIRLNLPKFPIDGKSKIDSAYRDLFEKLNTIYLTKDSIIKMITPQMNKEEFIGILEKFRGLIIDLHKPTYPTKEIELYLNHDLKFFRENINPIPKQMYPELFKHIIERWTHESYSSFLQNWT